MLYIEEIFASLLQLKIFQINFQHMENTAIFHKQTVYVTLNIYIRTNMQCHMKRRKVSIFPVTSAT